MEQTLLLNATYEPLMVIDWQRAITLFFLGKGDILEEYTRPIRCTSTRMHVPAVLRLRDRVRKVQPLVRFSRTNLYARDGYCCQYCGRRLTRAQLTFDHVLPRSRGGKTCWTNVVSACVPCNGRKRNRTPEEARMRLLREPVRPRGIRPFLAKLEQSAPESWRFYLWR